LRWPNWSPRGLTRQAIASRAERATFVLAANLVLALLFWLWRV
jgi:hypothetical protein